MLKKIIIINLTLFKVIRFYTNHQIKQDTSLLVLKIVK